MKTEAFPIFFKMKIGLECNTYAYCGCNVSYVVVCVSELREIKLVLF